MASGQYSQKQSPKWERIKILTCEMYTLNLLSCNIIIHDMHNNIIIIVVQWVPLNVIHLVIEENMILFESLVGTA